MQMDNRLTQSEQAGTVVTFGNPSPAERDAIMLHFTAMRGAGHAVIADEVTHGDGPAELKIHHYRTCERCRKGAL